MRSKLAGHPSIGAGEAEFDGSWIVRLHARRELDDRELRDVALAPLTRRAPRRWSRLLERLDSGRRRVLSREAHRAAQPGWRADAPRVLPGTGGPPAIASGAKRDGSGSRTLRQCSTPVIGRVSARGVEPEDITLERGRVDAVFAEFLFMAAIRRSEVNGLRCADVADSTDGGGISSPSARARRTRKARCTTWDLRRMASSTPSVRSAPPEVRTGRPRGAVVGADDRITVHGCGASRRHGDPRHRALWSGRAGVGTDEP